MAVSLSLIYPVLVVLSSVVLYLSLRLSESVASKRRMLEAVSIVVLAMMFGAMGYNATSHPDYSLDWERISYEIEWSKEVGPLPLLRGSYAAHPLSAVLLYVVGAFGSPLVLRFASSFVFASCVGILAWKFGEKEGAPLGALFWFSAFATVDYGNSLLVNIRFELAAIICIFSYLNITIFSGNRLVSYGLMVIAVGLHSGILFVSIIFLLLGEDGRDNAKPVYWMLVVIGPLLVATAPYLESLPIVGAKIEAYVSSGWSNGSISIKNMIFNLSLPLWGLLIVSTTSLKKGRYAMVETRGLSQSVLGMSLFSLSMLILTDNFARYAQLIPLLITPLVLILAKSAPSASSSEKGVSSFEKSRLISLLYMTFVVLALLFRSLFTYRFYEIVFP